MKHSRAICAFRSLILVGSLLLSTNLVLAADGPVALAQDYMVFNVTKEDIRVRMSAVDDEINEIYGTNHEPVFKDQ